MHELSVIASLFDILEEKAREQGAGRILSVTLRVGKLAGVVPDCLATAFDVYKKETIASEASLEIEEVPFKVRCHACETETETEDYVFICSECGSSDLEILDGTDLLLAKVILADIS